MRTDMTLNLDEGFGQCGPPMEFKTSMFPAGERYIQLVVPQEVFSVRINKRLNGSADIMELLMAVDALKRRGVTDIELFIPYFPYSRQDRVCDVGEAFSLKVMCKLLHDLEVHRIITYDVHSNVPEVLLDNLVNYHNHREIVDFLDYLSLANDDITLIAPDLGAVKKVLALRNNYTHRFEKRVVVCRKQREKDGRITMEDIRADLTDRTCLVVDDICDGGATFLVTAEKLKQAGASQLYLFISHGLLSKGYEELAKHYRMIGTSNSIRNGGGDCVKVFNLNY
jgi:ribose-phosphate pyrophosphokinase